MASSWCVNTPSMCRRAPNAVTGSPPTPSDAGHITATCCSTWRWGCSVKFGCRNEEPTMTSVFHYPLALIASLTLGATGAAWAASDDMQGMDHSQMQGMDHSQMRSEERRVGKEGVSTCRSRVSPDH